MPAALMVRGFVNAANGAFAGIATSSLRTRLWPPVSISIVCVSSSSTTMRICGALCARCCTASALAKSLKPKTAPPDLEAFMQHVPDIVITDWAMPIFDGLELHRR